MTSQARRRRRRRKAPLKEGVSSWHHVCVASFNTNHCLTILFIDEDLRIKWWDDFNQPRFRRLLVPVALWVIVSGRASTKNKSTWFYSRSAHEGPPVEGWSCEQEVQRKNKEKMKVVRDEDAKETGGWRKTIRCGDTWTRTRRTSCRHIRPGSAEEAVGPVSSACSGSLFYQMYLILTQANISVSSVMNWWTSFWKQKWTFYLLQHSVNKHKLVDLSQCGPGGQGFVERQWVKSKLQV